MDNVFFYNSFGFREYSCIHTRKVDNSYGVTCNFVAYVRKGTYTLSTDTETVSANEGELIYIPSGLAYRSVWAPGTILDSFGFSYAPLPENVKFGLKKMTVNGEMLSLIDKIAADKQTACSSVGHFYLLLDLLLPHLMKQDTDQKTAVIEKAKRYIYTHLDFKVSDLAKHCNVSESGLFALFKKTLSISPVELKNRYKAQKAAEFLETTDMTVEEISSRLSFSSPSYLRKVLKAEFGMTPKEIRGRSVMRGANGVTCGADCQIPVYGCDQNAEDQE